MKVFIVGVTGLLGADAARELISRGHSVVGISLPPVPKGAQIDEKIELHLGDINQLSDQKLKKIMQGCEAFVFASGVDERVEFAPPVYNAYKKYNIEPVQRLLTLAKEVGVKKSVILGSYFSYFAKVMPHLKLTENHPYIKSRIEQENVAINFSDDKMDVMVLELPYIFGAQRGRKPVWSLYIDLLLPMKKRIYFPKGGTTMVTVKQVSQSIVGALEKGVGGTCYPVGYFNKTWKELLTLVTKYMGYPDKKVITIPTFLYRLFSYKMAKDYDKKGIEPGLSPIAFVDLMTTNCFIDRKIIIDKLGVSDDDIEEAIKDSITYAMEIHKNNESVVTMKAE